MATVTGLTKERMLAIEAESIVDGDVNDTGHLILTRHDGSTIDAGYIVDRTNSVDTVSDQTINGNKKFLQALRATAPDHYFGDFADNAGGSRLHLGAFVSGESAGIAAESTSGNADLYLRSQGTGVVYVQNDDGDTLMSVDPNGILKSIGSDHYFGAYAGGAPGGRLHIGSFVSPSSAGIAAEAHDGISDLYLRSQGTGAIYIQTGTGDSLLSVESTGLLRTIGTDQYFGPYAYGVGAGVSRLRINHGAGASYIMVEGDGANRDLAFVTKGSGGWFFENPKDTTTLAQIVSVDPGLTGTSLKLAVHNNGGWHLVDVTLGAADTGGSGARVLIVPN